MKVLVTGASGFIGSALCDSLLARGDTVVGLTRDPETGAEHQPERHLARLGADPGTARRPRPSRASTRVVNLLGEKINQRWTDEAKERIMESRRTGTHNLVGTIAGLERKPRGAGQPVGDRLLRRPRRRDRRRVGRSRARASTPRSCASGRRRRARSRRPACGLSIVRTGHVLDPDGGLLAKLLPPFKLGVGGPLAGGGQYVSWIHIDDEVGLILWAIDNEEVSGVVNLTAPNPVTNRELSKALGRALASPRVVPVPGFALDLKYGSEFGEVLRGRPAGRTPPGARPRLRVPAPRARRGAGGLALGRPRSRPTSRGGSPELRCVERAPSDRRHRFGARAVRDQARSRLLRGSAR